MKKLSEKHKKILKAILIPLIIILTIFMAVNICKTADKEKYSGWSYHLRSA